MNIGMNITCHNHVPRWVRKLKGLFQVLWETRWINPELPRSKYSKAGKKGQDFDYNGKLKPKIAHLSLTHLMASHPDFAVEMLGLEHLADELGYIGRFTAKYHCKILGEGVENGWGFSKKIIIACLSQRSATLMSSPNP
jgi:hypothetical protein